MDDLLSTSKNAITQSKETEFSKRICDLEASSESITHMFRADKMVVKEEFKADRTIQKTLENDLVQVAFWSIKIKISESNLKLERKTKLGQEAEDLYQDFKRIKQTQEAGKRFAQIYIMEGPTGVPQDVGRSSSDPDENMALASIVFLTKIVEQTAVISVPDEANCQRTLQFIEDVGGKAELLFEHEGPLEPSVIYISSMASKEDMNQIGELTREGREITVLGPPLGEAHLLVTGENDGSTMKVNIMGAAKVENGKFVGESTNTREKASAPFFAPFSTEDALKKVTFYSSSGMGKMTILFEEYQALAGTSLLLTKKDTDQWAANTREQFLGAFTAIKDLKLPGSMLAKRLDGAEILTILYGENAIAISNIMKEDPGRRVLGFERFFEASYGKSFVDTAAIDQEIQKLGVTAVDWNNTSNVKQFLKDHIGEFQQNTAFNDVQDLEDSYQKCLRYIDGMSAGEGKAALISILSAYKNVYEEKTVGGWQATVENNRNPWEFANFKSALNTNGKQVPYDTLVVYAAALDKPKLDENDGDKALLLIL